MRCFVIAVIVGTSLFFGRNSLGQDITRAEREYRKAVTQAKLEYKKKELASRTTLMTALKEAQEKATKEEWHGLRNLNTSMCFLH